MLRPQYTTTNEIIERVKRDYGFEDVLIEEIKEWIWDAIGLMGCVEALRDKNTQIEIVNYRGVIPVDFYNINNGGIREVDTSIVFVESTNVHYLNPSSSVQESTEDEWANEHTYYQNSSNVEDEDEEYGFLRNVPFLKTDVQYTYKIKENYIYVGIENTTIEMSYQAFPISSDGTPAIPDDAKYIRAVVAYCAYMIARRLKYKNEIARDDYIDIKDDYAWAVGSAKTWAKVPSLDLLEAMKNRSLRLIPTISEHDSYFKYSGLKERLPNI